MDAFIKHYVQLVAVLPIENLSEFVSRGLLPGDHKQKIESLDTRNKKAEYFLDKIIRPGIEISYRKQFNEMLELMKNTDDDTVKHLARKITESVSDDHISRDVDQPTSRTGK